MPITTESNKPWFKHGRPITGRLTVREALQVGGCDWDAALVHQSAVPTATEPAELFGLSNPEQRMVVRMDTQGYLGSVGRAYTIVQNRDAFSFFDHALGQDAACIEAVGVLGRYGARVFMVAALPDMLEIVPGDPLRRHILLTSTHDGSGNIEAIFVHWREKTGTQVQFTGKTEGRVKIRHTKNAEKHIKAATMVLNADEQYWARAARAYRYMAKRDMDAAALRDFLRDLFPDKRDDAGALYTTRQAQERRDEMKTLIERQEETSAWGAYNAVCYFVDHARESKAKGIGRWEISVFGPGGTLRERAFRLLTRGFDAETPDTTQ